MGREERDASFQTCATNQSLKHKRMARFILIRRRNKILYLEFLGAAVVAAWLTTTYIRWHPAIGVLIGIVAYFLLAYLFFAFQFFRSGFSILFSLGWAAVAFVAGQYVENDSEAIAWAFALVASVLSLWAHWDHFRFLKSAGVREYEM